MAGISVTSSNFRLIQGGLQSQTVFAFISVVAAPEESPPFEVDAVAFEEDTWLVMSADPKIADPPEHPIRLMTGLGSKNSRPARASHPINDRSD